MGILNRYIIKEIIKTLLLVWLGLAGVVFFAEWFSNMFRWSSVSFLDRLLYYVFKVPHNLQLVFPPSILAACLIVLGNMNKNKELVAAHSIGTSRFSLFKSVGAAVLIASAFYVGFSFYLAPLGIKKHLEHYDVKIKNRKSRFAKLRKEKIWFKNKDIIYNIGFFNPEKKEIYDVVIYHMGKNFQLNEVTHARQASWNGKMWVLEKGSSTIHQEGVVSTQEFEKQETTILSPPENLKRFEFNPDAMTQAQLGQTVKRYKKLGIDSSAWSVIYHSRISFIFVALVFFVLAFAISFKFERKSSIPRDLGFVLLFSFFYWVVYNYFLNLGSRGQLSPIVAAWVPTIVTAIGVGLYAQKKWRSE